MYLKQNTYKGCRAALLSIALCSTMLFAQVKSSTITGSVVDSTGAAIPDATVTVTNLDTNVSVVSRTTSSGDYTVPYLIAGRYKVAVDKPGFTSSIATGAEVTSDATARVNITLSVGSESTTVNVSTGVAELQTEDASVQGSISAELIDALPNINANPLLYATLQPGVVAEKSAHDTTSVDSFSIGPHSRRAMSMISVNGGLGLTNDIQLDGVPILGSDYNEEGIVPNQEGLQEVRVQTNTFTAEFGRGTGIIQYNTKTGTNAFHGSAVYRARNEAFNANGFANNFNGETRGGYKVDYYGGSIGGPIWKNRMFFFGSYEGLYHTNPIDFLLTVPTALEREGDFSQTLTPGNDNQPVPVQLYDPFHVTPVAGTPNTYERPLIPNATLTGSLLDPVGQKLYSNYPMPNRTPIDVYGTHNFYTRKPQIYHRNSTQARVDFKVGKNSIYGAGGIASGNINVPQPLGADNPFYPPVTWGQTITDSNPYAAVGDTVILSPTLVLDVRYGVNRMESLEGYGPKSSKFDVSGYDIPSNIQGLFNDPTQPFDFCPEGKYDCLNFGLIQHINEKQTDHNAVGSITKILKQWTFKTGAEYRVGLLNAANPAEATFEVGNRWNNQNYTAQYTDATGDVVGSLMPNNQQYGFQAAQYMMGAGYLVAGSSVASALAMKYTAVYGQADWKVTPRLTVNLGLRWEVQPGPTERYNRQSSFDFSRSNTFGPGNYVFPGTNGYGRNLYATHYRDFGPRAGVEYQMSNSIVVRAGLGYAYLPTNTGYGFTSQNNIPFTAHNVQNSTAVFGPNPNGQLIGTFYSPQVNTIVPAVGTSTTNPLQYGGSNSGFLNYRNTLDGRVMQYNVFVEQSFTPKTIFSLGYSGSHADQMPFTNVPVNGYGTNAGASPPGFQKINTGTLAKWRQQYIASGAADLAAYDQVVNPYASTGFQGGALSSATLSAWRLQVPYPEFPDLNVAENNASASYNSMIAEVRHTYGSGLELDVNYVWSKEMDDMQNTGQSNDAFNNAGEQNTGYLLDLNNESLNRHLGYNDVTNRIVITGLIESPFGSNKRFLSSNKLASAVLGGWRVGSSFQYQTGTPIELTSSMGSMNNRPNRVPGVSPLLPKSLQHWYTANVPITIPGPNGPVQVTSCSYCYEYLNPLAFSGPTIKTPTGYAPDVFWYGNQQVTDSAIRSKNNLFLDAQLQRDFRITERLHFALAANAFNVMNHTNFQPAQAFGVGGLETDLTSPIPIGSATGSGNFGLNFYDPRQLQIQGKLTF